MNSSVFALVFSSTPYFDYLVQKSITITKTTYIPIRTIHSQNNLFYYIENVVTFRMGWDKSQGFIKNSVLFLV